MRFLLRTLPAILLLAAGCRTTSESVVQAPELRAAPALDRGEHPSESQTGHWVPTQDNPAEVSRAKSESGDAAERRGSTLQLVSATEPASGPDAETESPAVEDDASPTPADGELSLLEVIQIAASANPDVEAAVERTWIADATLQRARAEFYPTLSVSESYGVSNNPVNVFGFQLNQARLTFNQDFNNPATTDNFDTRLRLQHGIYTGGRRTASREAAAWQTQAANAGVQSARNQLMFRIAEAYFRLLQANRLVGVREETVQQVEQHLSIVQSRFRAETAVESDVLTVEVRLAEAREALISTRHQLELAWAVLDNVVGTTVPRRPLPEAIPEAPWDGHVDDVEAAVAAALSARPELQQLHSGYHAALHQVDAAEAGNRPTVGFVGDYDVFTGDFRTGNDSFFVGLVVELNLLDFGRTESAVAQASAQAREIAARQRRAVSDIELDVRRAWLQLRDARERLKVSEKAIAQARESLREVESRYRGQATTITRLIDAQVALSNARVRRANAQAEVEIARSALERAVGRLSDIAR